MLLFYLQTFQILEDTAKGRMTVHHANIMKFNIPSAFPKAHTVKWDSLGKFSLISKFFLQDLVPHPSKINVCCYGYSITELGNVVGV